MEHYEKQLFISKEKEEFWLNQRAMNGLSLKLYQHKIYVFEKTSKDRPYHYRIQLLEKPYKTNKVSFPKGVDVIGEEGRWVYLRKNAKEGGFDFYADLPLRLTYYKRLTFFYFYLLSLSIALTSFLIVYGLSVSMVWPFILGGIIGLSTLILIYPLVYLIRIRKLLKQSQKDTSSSSAK